MTAIHTSKTPLASSSSWDRDVSPLASSSPVSLQASLHAAATSADLAQPSLLSGDAASPGAAAAGVLAAASYAAGHAARSSGGGGAAAAAKTSFPPFTFGSLDTSVISRCRAKAATVERDSAAAPAASLSSPLTLPAARYSPATPLPPAAAAASTAATTPAAAAAARSVDAAGFRMHFLRTNQQTPSPLLPPTADVVYSSPSADVVLLARSFGHSLPPSCVSLSRDPAAGVSPSLSFAASLPPALATPPYCQINAVSGSCASPAAPCSDIFSLLRSHLRWLLLQLLSLFASLSAPSFYPSFSLHSPTYLEAAVVRVCSWCSIVLFLLFSCCLRLVLFLPRLLLQCVGAGRDPTLQQTQQAGAFAAGTCSAYLFPGLQTSAAASISPLQQQIDFLYLVVDGASSDRAQQIDGGGAMLLTLLLSGKGASRVSAAGGSAAGICGNIVDIISSKTVLYGHSPAAVILRNRGKSSSLHAAVGIAAPDSPPSSDFSSAAAPPPPATAATAARSSAVATVRGSAAAAGSAAGDSVAAAAASQQGWGWWSGLLWQWLRFPGRKKKSSSGQCRYPTAALILSPAASPPLLLVGYSDGRLETLQPSSSRPLFTSAVSSSSSGYGIEGSSNNIPEDGMRSGWFEEEAFNDTSSVERPQQNAAEEAGNYMQRTFTAASSSVGNLLPFLWQLIDVEQLHGPVLYMRASPCSKRICALTSRWVYTFEICEEVQQPLSERSRSGRVDDVCKGLFRSNLYRCSRFSSLLAFGKEALCCCCMPLACCWTNSCQLLLLSSDGRLSVFFRDPRKTLAEWRCLTRLQLEPGVRKYLRRELVRSSRSPCSRSHGTESGASSSRRESSREGAEGSRDHPLTANSTPGASFKQDVDAQSYTGNDMRSSYRCEIRRQQRKAGTATQKSIRADENGEVLLSPPSSSSSASGVSSAWRTRSMVRQEKTATEEKKEQEEEEEAWETSFPAITFEYSRSQQIVYISLRGYPRLLIVPWKVLYTSVLSSSSSFFYVPLTSPVSTAAAVSSIAAQRRRGRAGGLLASLLRSKLLYRNEKLLAPLHAVDFAAIIGRTRKHQLQRQKKLLEREQQEGAAEREALGAIGEKQQIKEAVGGVWLGVEHGIARRRTGEKQGKRMPDEEKKQRLKDFAVSQNRAVGGIVSFALTTEETPGASYLAVLHAQCDSVYIYDGNFFNREDALLQDSCNEEVLLEEEEQQQQRAPVMRFCVPPPHTGYRPGALTFLSPPATKMPGLSFFSPSPSAGAASAGGILLVVRWVYPLHEKEQQNQMLLPAFTLFYSLPSLAAAAADSFGPPTLFPAPTRGFLSQLSHFPFPLISSPLTSAAAVHAGAAASTRIAAAEQETLNAWRTAAGLDSTGTDTAATRLSKTIDADTALRDHSSNCLEVPICAEKNTVVNDYSKSSNFFSNIQSAHGSSNFPNVCRSSSLFPCDSALLNAHRQGCHSTYTYGREPGNQYWQSKEPTNAHQSGNLICQAAATPLSARRAETSGVNDSEEAAAENNIRNNTTFSGENATSPDFLESSMYNIDRYDTMLLREKSAVKSNVVLTDSSNSNAGATYLNMLKKGNVGEQDTLATDDFSLLQGESGWLQRWQVQQQELLRRWRLQQPQQQTDQERLQTVCHSDIEIPPPLPASFARWTPSYQRTTVQRSAPYSFLHPYNATDFSRFSGLQTSAGYNALLQQQRFIQQQQRSVQEQQGPFVDPIPAPASDHLHNVLRQRPVPTLSHDVFNSGVSNCLAQGTTCRRANLVSPAQTNPLQQVCGEATSLTSKPTLFNDDSTSVACSAGPNQSIYVPLLQQENSATQKRDTTLRQQQLGYAVRQPVLQNSSYFTAYMKNNAVQRMGGRGPTLFDLDFSIGTDPGGLASRTYTEACHNPQTNPLTTSALRLSNTSILQPFTSTTWTTDYNTESRTSIF